MTIERREIPTPQVRQIGPEENRTLRFRFSDESVDRHNTRLIRDGWKTEQYEKNPVVFWGHEVREMPIGRTVAIERALDGGKKVLDGDIQFASREVYPFADLVYRMCRDGFLKGTSAGFTTLKKRSVTDAREIAAHGFRKDRPAEDLLENELMEISIVPVPSNKNTLIATLKKEAPEMATRIFEDLPEAEQTDEWVAAALEDIRMAFGPPKAAAPAPAKAPAPPAPPAKAPAPADAGQNASGDEGDTMSIDDAMQALVEAANSLQDAATQMGNAHSFLEALMEMDGQEQEQPEEPAAEGEAAPPQFAKKDGAVDQTREDGGKPDVNGSSVTSPQGGKVLIVGKFKELRLKVKRKGTGKPAASRELQEGEGPMRQLFDDMEKRLVEQIKGTKKSELVNLQLQVEDLSKKLGDLSARVEGERSFHTSTHRDALTLCLEGKSEVLERIRSAVSKR